jgi:hypothetical protein
MSFSCRAIDDPELIGVSSAIPAVSRSGALGVSEDD